MTLPQHLKSTGSLKGNTYTTNSMRCGKFLYLRDTLTDFHYTNPNLRMGSAFGMLASKFHGWEPLIPYSNDDIIDGICQSLEETEEVRRLWDFYSASAAVDEWGIIEAIEPKAPANDEERNTAGYPFNLREASPDLVLLVTPEKSAYLADVYGIMVPPGRIMLDFKTYSKWDRQKQQELQYGTQYLTYPSIWNRARPHQKVDGTLFVAVMKHKKVNFKFLYAPYDPKNDAVVFDMIEYSEWVSKTSYGKANAASCLAPYTCPFLEQGLCDRRTVENK